MSPCLLGLLNAEILRTHTHTHINLTQKLKEIHSLHASVLPLPDRKNNSRELLLAINKCTELLFIRLDMHILYHLTNIYFAS